MDTQVAFKTGPFAVTQEVWKKARDYLGIQNADGRTHIKRIGPDQIQIIQYEEVDKKSIFVSSANQKTKVIASFMGKLKGNEKVWIKS